MYLQYTADIWILKEAWGKDFGEEGFIRVQNKPGHNCGIGDYIVTASLNQILKRIKKQIFLITYL